MDLTIKLPPVELYKSKSQIARVSTEGWVKQNIYCPACGNENLNQFVNNSPVADFICNGCKSEYELKSKMDRMGLKIVDGAYDSMLRRIYADNNPNFFFLNYSITHLTVQNLMVIPKHFFVSEIIEKRPPLNINARRAGWVGCNILLNEIPASGKIFLVKNGLIQKKEIVLEEWQKTAFLSEEKKDNKKWLIEIMKVVDTINNQEFALKEVYKFEESLKQRFPNNNFIKDKIRQQLQVLRDKGIIEFKGGGYYKKL